MMKNNEKNNSDNTQKAGLAMKEAANLREESAADMQELEDDEVDIVSGGEDEGDTTDPDMKCHSKRRRGVLLSWVGNQSNLRQ